MVNSRIMALVAIVALIGATSALALPAMITQVFAQGNMTENMTEGTTGNMTEGGNMTAESGNISGLPAIP